MFVSNNDGNILIVFILIMICFILIFVDYPNII